MYTDLSSSESLVLHTRRGLIDCRGRWRGGERGERGRERGERGGRGRERGERERVKLGGNPKYALKFTQYTAHVHT